jgi:hypothetical protein
MIYPTRFRQNSVPSWESCKEWKRQFELPGRSVETLISIPQDGRIGGGVSSIAISS